MKNDKKQKKIIFEIIKLINKNKPTPEQLRYIFKKVRDRTRIKRPFRPKAPPKFYTPAEMYSMLETARKISPKHRLLLDILFSTGLRISELQKLDLRDINDEHNGGTIHIREGKGKKDRFIPISGTVMNSINVFVQPRKVGGIFTNNQSQSISVRSMQRWYDEIIKKARVLKKGGSHTARHTFAVICLARGMPKEDIQQILGHSTIILK